MYAKRHFNIFNFFYDPIEGAIFASDDEVAEIAFRHAVLRENMYNAFELKPIIKRIDPFDSFEAERTGKMKTKFITAMISVTRLFFFYFL